MSFPVDQLVLTPGDIDLSRSPLAGHLDAETYVLGAFNPGMTRLPNGNLLIMVRVAEALRKELSSKGIKVGLVEPGLTGSDLQYPGIPADKQREMINAEKMLRAEDIAVAVHFMLTQPRRAVVQQLAVTQRVSEEA